MSPRGRFQADSAKFHRGRKCDTCTQFYTEGGVVHPIRNSPGYSNEVEAVQREAREHRRLERTYGRERQERHAQVVKRPSWAGGISESNLLKIAAAHGQHASQEGWWERAGLTGSVKADQRRAQRAERMSGELHYELAEGAHKGDTRRMATRRAARAPAKVERYKRAADLPF